MKVKTRFAPSPTGALHIGGARTALFNYYFAKRFEGEFLLRIEDTDRARSTDENVNIILDSLKWLGLDWDGEPVSQFERADRHREIAKTLVEKGKAYYCYTSTDELKAMREETESKGEHFKYPGIWRDRDPSEAPKGVDGAIRLKLPKGEDTTVYDEVQGNVTISNDELDDFVIMRSDGSPTYLLAVVVDDHDMEISHVIRGEDHMTNTFKQSLIYEAMGWKKPSFAHVPLIHGPDGKKMSKRHGATGVADYKAMGILPEAMRNYLLRLGWAHGDEEIIPDDRAIEVFDLEGIGRAPARFDLDKLKALNGHYINGADNCDLVTEIIPILDARGYLVSDRARIWMHKGMDDLKERAKTLYELADIATFYCAELPLDYDEKALSFIGDDHKDTLTLLKAKFVNLEPFETDKIDEACKQLSQDHDIKMKNVMMPLRAALTGITVTPHLGKIAEIFGRDEVLKRLDAAIEQ